MCSERDCRIFRGQIVACDRCARKGETEANQRPGDPTAGG